MTDTGLEALETTAAAYEDRLVPAVFASWAQTVADAAQLRRGQRVLDVACGTGALTRTVAERLGPDGSVTGLDANPGMLAVAARLSPEIEWRRGEAETLPFDDGAFDVVVSQFGLMLFTDPEAALRQMMRVLVSGGRLAVAVFDNLENNPPYAAMASIFARHVDEATGDALRFPFSMGDTDRLASLFVAAGIAVPAIAGAERTARFASIRDMVLADVEGWFPLAGLHVDDEALDAVVDEARQALASAVAADGGVAFRTRAHIVTATKA